MYKVACAIEEYVVIFYQAEVVTMNIHTLTAEDQTMTNSRETAKATKLWRFKIDQYGEGECYIHDELGYYVGQVKDTLTAQEIVKAVNNHEALLEACREAYNFAKTYQANSGDDSLETQEHIDKLFNVINQASK
jgi:hypothetical protein